VPHGAVRSVGGVIRSNSKPAGSARPPCAAEQGQSEGQLDGDADRSHPQPRIGIRHHWFHWASGLTFMLVIGILQGIKIGRHSRRRAQSCLRAGRGLESRSSMQGARRREHRVVTRPRDTIHGRNDGAGWLAHGEVSGAACGPCRRPRPAPALGSVNVTPLALVQALLCGGQGMAVAWMAR
jgi:hypothetical protein